MQLTTIHFLLAFIGLFLHVMLKIGGRRKNQSVGSWISRNLRSFLFSIIAVGAILLLLPEWTQNLSPTLKENLQSIDRLLVFLIGMFSSSLIRNLYNFGKRQIKFKFRRTQNYLT